MTHPRLAAQGIQIQYTANGPPILAQFSLAVYPGEMIGIVGPNGSGKSTLIRALARSLRPAQGSVLLGETDLYAQVSARQAAQTLGVVPQETSVTWDFTVREVVRMGRSPHLPRRPFATENAVDEEIVADALRRAGVEELADRRVPTLSGGERQRVLLARALAQQPEALLLDEPTAHLDIYHQTQMLTLVQSLAHQDHRAVLAVLHDLNLAAAFCDRLVLLHEGKIVAQGLPAEVLTAGNLMQVYGARVWVRRHPVSGRPLVLTLPEPPPKSEEALPAVHILCGGGTGAALLLALSARGFAVTVGALNAGDTDAEAADLLGLPYARENSFSALSEPVLAEAARLAASADTVILTEVPFGPANLANLEAALTLRRLGKRVICIHSGNNFDARDFTGGRASALWAQIVAAGASVVSTIDAAVRLATPLAA